MDIKDIKELILTIDQTSIEKVEIENGNERISISKFSKKDKEEIKVENINREIEIPKTIEEQPMIEEQPKIDEKGDNIFIVKSPIVGVFYGTPSPDAKPFANVGDFVKKGQPLCIIEAMKIMNEIESEESGEIIEILVKNEEIVEYGQPLMKIRR